jgi:alpha-beta hydrolase superfamily lysophospholipase
LQRRHPGLVDGLAMICPGLVPKVGAGFWLGLRVFFAYWFTPRRRFPVPLNDPSLFTASERWQQFIHDDPLSVREATARLLFSNHRLSRYLWIVPRRVQVPVLVMLAEHDRIVDNARTRRYVERFASTDRHVIEYPGAHHTLEFEPDPDRFIGDLLAWLGRQSSLHGT